MRLAEEEVIRHHQVVRSSQAHVVSPRPKRCLARRHFHPADERPVEYHADELMAGGVAPHRVPLTIPSVTVPARRNRSVIRGLPDAMKVLTLLKLSNSPA